MSNEVSMLEAVENEMKSAKGKKSVEARIECWRLRLIGYSYERIAAETGKSLAGAWRSVRWCRENLPSAIDGIPEVREQSYTQLVDMCRELKDRADALTEAGEEVPEWNYRTRILILDTINKMVGLYTNKVELSMKEPSEYEKAGVTAAIVTRPVLDLPSEEVTDDFEEDDPFGFEKKQEPEAYIETDRKTERRRRRRDARKERSEVEKTDPRAHTANYPMRWHKDAESSSSPKR